jgi:hypothetical protein
LLFSFPDRDARRSNGTAVNDCSLFWTRPLILLKIDDRLISIISRHPLLLSNKRHHVAHICEYLMFRLSDKLLWDVIAERLQYPQISAHCLQEEHGMGPSTILASLGFMSKLALPLCSL